MSQGNEWGVSLSNCTRCSRQVCAHTFQTQHTWQPAYNGWVRDYILDKWPVALPLKGQWRCEMWDTKFNEDLLISTTLNMSSSMRITLLNFCTSQPFISCLFPFPSLFPVLFSVSFPICPVSIIFLFCVFFSSTLCDSSDYGTRGSCLMSSFW